MQGTEAVTPKPEQPKSLLARMEAALPIAMTALATVLAGLSTSELQRAMFWRTTAGQDQAKATNQWTLAGFKRDRALIMQTSAAQLRAQGGYQKETLPASDTTAKPEEKQALVWLTGQGPPPAALPVFTDETLLALLEAIRHREPEADLLVRAARVPQARINQVIDAAEKAVETVDREWEPTLRAASQLVAARAQVGAATAEAARQAAAIQAAGYELEQRRYRAEATLNQGVGLLYEARVKVETAESDRHRVRSQNFFYAMLVAQIGAVLSSLAMARRQKSALWLMAGLAGAVAVAGGAYVYMTM